MMADRYYLATFDLVNSEGRQAEYAKARAALEFLVGGQNYYRPVKQCCILKSDGSVNAARIKKTLTQNLGSDCNVLVVRLRHGHAIHLLDRENRIETEALLAGLPN